MTDHHVDDNSKISKTSSSLIKAARENDRPSWQRLVDQYGVRVYGWCRKKGLPSEDSADVCQEVLVSVARNLHRFHHEREGDSFRKWIWSITMNKIRDHWRRQHQWNPGVGGSTWLEWIKRIADEEDLDASLSVDPQSQSNQAMKLIEQVRLATPDRDWAILERLVVEEMTPEEVAKEFETSVNAIYLVKSRTRRRLRKLLAAHMKTESD